MLRWYGGSSGDTPAPTTQFRIMSLQANETAPFLLRDLRETLLALDPSGSQGFEGLIGTALTEVIGIPFRLAHSGAQFGVDGKSSSANSDISYECKRYRENVPRETVMAKLGELAIAPYPVDLWILCVTSEVGARLADDVSQFGTSHGTSTIVLDWSDIGIPRLATFLAMARSSVIAFLKNPCRSTKIPLGQVIADLETVVEAPGFHEQATRIREELDNPMLGLEAAKGANKRWLIDTFSNRGRARARLGQPLAPYDENDGMWHPRPNLKSQLIPFLTGSPCAKVLYVIGNEGVGKSWAIAESWLSTPTKPLMTFIPPDRFEDSVDKNDIQKIIVSALIEQTNVGRRRPVQDKWYSILERWRELRSSQIRCVVVVDGIDQRPGKDWAQIVERLSDELAVYDCQLIVTVRTSYYRSHIAQSLYLPSEELKVSDWTAEERAAILSRSQIQDEDLNHDVASALCNPRILGIALRLWSSEEVSNLNELSVSRLLFEHLRTTCQFRGPDYTIHSVVQMIRRHAESVTSRMQGVARHDLKVFEADLQTVVEERFFSLLEDDPTCYRINDDGLPLALGFLVLDRMRVAVRNGLDLDAELRLIIEPISALGMTASVVVAAITVACVDKEQTPEAGAAALIRIFADLQNPDDTDLRQLTRLAMDRPNAFALAARELCLAGGGQPNLDLIGDALACARVDRDAWAVFRDHIQSWLSHYSLWPPPRPRLTDDERQERHSKIESEFRATSDEFDHAEKSIMESLQSTDGDVDKLWELALSLLAGHELRPATGALVRWAFAAELYPEYPRSYRYFFHLIFLNRIDWNDTRTALLEDAAVLRSDEVSRKGKWALVRILRATGDPGDASEAHELVVKLTEDRQRIPQSWRLVEEYCKSDPCDPSSERPANVHATSVKYAKIDVRRFEHDIRNQEQLFFDMARPAMARFGVSLATNMHRLYIHEIVSNADSTWRPDLSDLRAHNVLFSEKSVDDLRSLILSLSKERRGLEKDDLWIVVQHLMLLAFPLLTGSGQLHLLMHTDMEPMLDLVENLRPLETGTFDQCLETACKSDIEPAQFALLLLATETSMPISSSSRQLVAKLFNTASDRVRAQAMGLIARLGDITLIAEVARSDWRASPNMRYDESSYGARVLAMAARDRVISFADAICRMATRDYGMASQLWRQPSAVREIACRVDRSIRQLVALVDDLDPPALEIRVHRGDRLRPKIATSIDRLFPPNGFFGDDETDEILKRNEARIRSFSTDLEERGCHIVVDHVDLGEFLTIVRADTRLADGWRKIFVRSSRKKLRVFHNLVLLLGNALSESNPDHAATLFELVKNQRPMIPVRYGSAGVSLDSLAVWAGSDTHILNRIRYRRLDGTASDDALSKEVLAAHLSGKQQLLYQYIQRNLDRGDPGTIARALMVGGFSDENEYSENVLSRHGGTDGFVGEVCNAAKFAYERNLWARHWFGGMCQATDPQEFWRCSVLFLKVVDGRYDTWGTEYGDHSDAMRRFRPNLGSSLSNRIKKWRRKRESKLFGAARPNDVFLSPPPCQQ